MDKDISATELAFFETDVEEAFAEDYIETLDCVTVFRDEIKKNLAAIGFAGNMENTADIIDFVCNCCKNAFPKEFDDPNDKSRKVKFNRKTLSRWLDNDDVPVSNMDSREIMYKLCFALNMDENATRNFFYKGCLERPFNYKNIRESVYYFCLKHHIGYAQAMRILEKIETAPAAENADADSVTSVIANKVQKLQNEAELIEYLVENKSGFTLSNNTAYKKIDEELLPACMKYATMEQQFLTACDSGEADEEKAEKITNVDQLLSVIYGYDARATYEKENVYKYSISDKTASKFPRLIKENFPQRQQFENISKRKASTGVVRKTLIMLYFYEFFTQAYFDNPNSMSLDLFDEFIDEMNTMLEMCGYVQLYWRNPFDWMIGYCAQEAAEGGNPVYRLRDIITNLYLKYTQGTDEATLEG